VAKAKSVVANPDEPADPEGGGGFAEWWIAVAIPFRSLSTLAETTIAPISGTRWRGNLHRLRSQPTPLYAAWAPVDTPDPDFHRPSAFGTLRFE
jgi:hypothetical protein